MPTLLEQSILKTLCWFSVTDYPVTGFEIWKWLLEPDRAYELSEVFRVLESSEWLHNRITNENGYYMIQNDSISLPCEGEGRGEGFDRVAIRQEHYLDAIRKYKKLRRAVRFFSLFESVRAVAAVNTIAWWNTNASSDIDLFIITKPGSIWSTRFWIVTPFILFGVRPDVAPSPLSKGGSRGDVSQDPFCFSFFASRSALAMDHLRLKEGDHYFAFWEKSIVPLFDRDHSIELFHQENRWAHAQLPNAAPRRASLPPPLQGGVGGGRAFDPIRHTGFFESIYRSIQQKRFPESIRTLANQDSRVVITDEMLKFHDTDRRAEFQKKYEEQWQRLCA